MLAAMSVRQVLNLVEDAEYGPGRRFVVEEALREARIEEHRMQLTDFGRLPADALEEAVRMVVGWLKADVPAYVHCRAGWQRSAAVAAGAVAVYDGLGHRRGRRPTSRSASPPRTPCRTSATTSAPGGTRAAICILRASARFMSDCIRGVVARLAGPRRAARRSVGLRSKLGGASPSAARADLPAVLYRPGVGGSARRRGAGPSGAC